MTGKSSSGGTGGSSSRASGGGANKGGVGAKSSGTSSSSGGGSGGGAEPKIISGWEHARYANNGTQYAAERYAYLGKDETTGEPEWIDYGPKGSR